MTESRENNFSSLPRSDTPPAPGEQLLIAGLSSTFFLEEKSNGMPSISFSLTPGRSAF